MAYVIKAKTNNFGNFALEYKTPLKLILEVEIKDFQYKDTGSTISSKRNFENKNDFKNILVANLNTINITKMGIIKSPNTIDDIIDPKSTNIDYFSENDLNKKLIEKIQEQYTISGGKSRRKTLKNRK